MPVHAIQLDTVQQGLLQSNEQTRHWCALLEAGGILYFPQTPVPIPAEDLQFLLGQRQTGSSLHKNIAYKPNLDSVSGLDASTTGAAELKQLQAIMRQYSQDVTRFLTRFLSPYQGRWQLDYASFRPQEEEGRDLPLRRRNDLPDGWSDSLNYEIAAALAMGPVSAANLAGLARTLGLRLPGIGRLLADGTLTKPKAKLIAATFEPLDEGEAARAEALILGELKGKTWFQVQRLAWRAALAVAPSFSGALSAATSSFCPLATTRSTSSGSARCSFKASGAGADIHISISSALVRMTGMALA